MTVDDPEGIPYSRYASRPEVWHTAPYCLHLAQAVLAEESKLLHHRRAVVHSPPLDRLTIADASCTGGIVRSQEESPRPSAMNQLATL
jgi:hypothetical protein